MSSRRCADSSTQARNSTLKPALRSPRRPMKEVARCGMSASAQRASARLSASAPSSGIVVLASLPTRQLAPTCPTIPVRPGRRPRDVAAVHPRDGEASSRSSCSSGATERGLPNVDRGPAHVDDRLSKDQLVDIWLPTGGRRRRLTGSRGCSTMAGMRRLRKPRVAEVPVVGRRRSGISSPAKPNGWAHCLPSGAGGAGGSVRHRSSTTIESASHEPLFECERDGAGSAMARGPAPIALGAWRAMFLRVPALRRVHHGRGGRAAAARDRQASGSAGRRRRPPDRRSRRVRRRGRRGAGGREGSPGAARKEVVAGARRAFDAEVHTLCSRTPTTTAEDHRPEARRRAKRR
jgi:hypothetical protein